MFTYKTLLTYIHNTKICWYIYVYTYIQTYLQTYTPTYVHTYTFILVQIRCFSLPISFFFLVKIHIKIVLLKDDIKVFKSLNGIFACFFLYLYLCAAYMYCRCICFYFILTLKKIYIKHVYSVKKKV